MLIGTSEVVESDIFHASVGQTVRVMTTFPSLTQLSQSPQLIRHKSAFIFKQPDKLWTF